MGLPNQHRFRKYCIDGSQLVAGKTLRYYVKELAKQAKTQQSVEIYGGTNREKYLSDPEYRKNSYLSPIYFGEGGEFLRHCYFEFFGHKYNLEAVWSLNTDHGAIADDLGWDGGAVSIVSSVDATGVETNKGAPVYFQDKTTERFGHLHSINDGSRLMNFFGSAALHAIASGQAEISRFIVWTSGKGLNKALYTRTHGRVEVVGNDRISEDTDGNTTFWNYVAGKFVR